MNRKPSHTLYTAEVRAVVLAHYERAADFISYGAEMSGIVGVDYVASLTRDRAAEAVG